MKPFLVSLLFLAAFEAEAQHSGITKLPVRPLPQQPALEQGILDSLKSSTQYQSLSEDKKSWFYWTNYSRINPRRFWDSVIAPIAKTFPELDQQALSELKRDLINSPRLSLLKPNPKLATISQKHVQSIASNGGQPSHTSSDGTTFQDRMQAAEIHTCAGENISYGANNPLFMLVLLYIDEGVPDRGHRKSLLNPDFKEMGVGIANTNNDTVMVAQDFACEQSN